MSHDVRVHQPGETAVCSQCGATVKDCWVEMPHHEAGAVEVKTWCRGCLLEAVGIDAATVAKVRAEDAVCKTCGNKGAVDSEYREAEGGETWEDCPDCLRCSNCDGMGKTKTCANCEQPSLLISYGGCNHFCWPCNGTGKA